MPPPDDDAVWSRIKWGVEKAAYYVVLFLGIVLIKVALGQDLPGPLWAIIFTYAFGGVTTGAIIGLLRPWAVRSAFGAAITGFIALLPVSFAGCLVLVDRDAFRHSAPWAEIVVSGNGLLFGPYLRSRFGSDPV